MLGCQNLPNDLTELRAEWRNAGSTLNPSILGSKQLVLETEDLSNLQQIIDSIAQTGGGTIVIPSRSYTFNQPLKMRSNIALKGEVHQQTQLNFNLRGAFTD